MNPTPLFQASGMGAHLYIAPTAQPMRTRMIRRWMMGMRELERGPCQLSSYPQGGDDLRITFSKKPVDPGRGSARLVLMASGDKNAERLRRWGSVRKSDEPDPERGRAVAKGQAMSRGLDPNGTLQKLKARAKDLNRQLGSMKEGGHETDRAALRKEIASVEAAIAKAGG